MEIYVVSKEFYNDYEILGIYDSFEKAQLFVDCIKKNSGKMPEINMFKMNPFMEEIESGLHFYCVKEKNGEYIVKKSNDFSTPIDFGGYKVYKCWAKDENEALDAVKEGKYEFQRQ